MWFSRDPEEELGPLWLTHSAPPSRGSCHATSNGRHHTFGSEMEIVATRKFTVFEHGCRALAGKVRANNKSSRRSDPPAFETDVPTMRLREMNTANASRFIGLMEKHGFVVLTETGAIRKAYLEFMKLLKAFFEGDADWKESCKGGVYFNERGIPMWHAGYERCGRVREAFRVPAASPSPLPQHSWPCPRLHRSWLTVLHLLQRVCHRALTLALGRPVLGAPPPPVNSRRAQAAAAGGEPGKVGEEEEDKQEEAAAESTRSAGGGGDGGGGGGDGGDSSDEADFSVSYALYYPNEFADPALEEDDLTVGEHVDPSLFVAEPCCGVEGLEIRDRSTGSWLPVEALCAGLGGNGGRSLADAEGRELILFGGKALERATEGRVRGAPHRVRRGDLGRRYCFIYEQKYSEFFPPPALD